jgi:hypothetical protein
MSEGGCSTFGAPTSSMFNFEQWLIKCAACNDREMALSGTIGRKPKRRRRDFTSDSPHRSAWETFRVQIRSGEYIRAASEPLAESAPQAHLAQPDYVARVDILRDHALIEYRRIQEMFAFLRADRQSARKYVYVDQHHEATMEYVEAKQSQGWNNKYTLSFRDRMYNWSIDRVRREWGNKPAGWDNFANHAPLQQSMEQYRQHVAFIYYNFKYRYVAAIQRLETIAGETEAMCRRLQGDPLATTAFSYAARTAPLYQP